MNKFVEETNKSEAKKFKKQSRSIETFLHKQIMLYNNSDDCVAVDAAGQRRTAGDDIPNWEPKQKCTNTTDVLQSQHVQKRRRPNRQLSFGPVCVDEMPNQKEVDVAYEDLADFVHGTELNVLI